MNKYRVLILTDHSSHSSENSLYALAKTLRQHPACAFVDVADRSNSLNKLFFNCYYSKALFVSRVENDFSFDKEGTCYTRNLKRSRVEDYDMVWLRLPPPLSKPFLDFLEETYPSQLFINAPKGIYETGSKAFLINFQDCCAPMKICHSVEDILEFSQQFPIVLKPFREYGGKGILKIDGKNVWEGTRKLDFDTVLAQWAEQEIAYLAVKFLKNVKQGDKRIVVVKGEIMGASLRLPASNSWLCNVAMGGTSNQTEVNKEELKIIERLNPILLNLGIVMYGVDTLVDDHGKRVLSEINTSSIGGIAQISKMENKPLVQRSTDLIWDYILERKAIGATTN